MWVPADGLVGEVLAVPALGDRLGPRVDRDLERLGRARGRSRRSGVTSCANPAAPPNAGVAGPLTSSPWSQLAAADARRSPPPRPLPTGGPAAGPRRRCRARRRALRRGCRIALVICRSCCRPARAAPSASRRTPTPRPRARRARRRRRPRSPIRASGSFPGLPQRVTDAADGVDHRAGRPRPRACAAGSRRRRAARSTSARSRIPRRGRRSGCAAAPGGGSASAAPAAGTRCASARRTSRRRRRRGAPGRASVPRTYRPPSMSPSAPARRSSARSRAFSSSMSNGLTR